MTARFKQATAAAPAAYVHDITAVGAMSPADASKLVPTARWHSGHHQGRPALLGQLVAATDMRHELMRTLGRNGLDARVVVYRQHRDGTI